MASPGTATHRPEHRRRAPPPTSAAAVVLALVVLGTGGSVLPAAASPPGGSLVRGGSLRIGARERLERPDVVWLPAVTLTLGATEAEVAAAIALCRRHVPTDDARLLCPRERFADETPTRVSRVSAFGLDRREVALRDWHRCVLAGRCPPPRLPVGDPRVGQPNHPVGGVRWSEAATYRAFVGGRLPTEAEWERAARGRGPEQRFPWGRFYDPRRANHGGRRDPRDDGFRYAAPVGSYPDGSSRHGLLDLAGNVREWTGDRYDPERRHTGPAVDPTGPPGGGLRVVRGGSWRLDPASLRITARQPLAEDDFAVDLGFRCAYEAR